MSILFQCASRIWVINWLHTGCTKSRSTLLSIHCVAASNDHSIMLIDGISFIGELSIHLNPFRERKGTLTRNSDTSITITHYMVSLAHSNFMPLEGYDRKLFDYFLESNFLKNVKGQHLTRLRSSSRRRWKEQVKFRNHTLRPPTTVSKCKHNANQTEMENRKNFLRSFFAGITLLLLCHIACTISLLLVIIM